MGLGYIIHIDYVRLARSCRVRGLVGFYEQLRHLC